MWEIKTSLNDENSSWSNQRVLFSQEMLCNLNQNKCVFDLIPGLVYWSDRAEVGFYLNQFNSREEVIINLYKTPFLGGRTHTSSALTLLREDVFINSRGDRDLVSVLELCFLTAVFVIVAKTQNCPGPCKFWILLSWECSAKLSKQPPQIFGPNPH